jgi:glutathione S-transferase
MTILSKFQQKQWILSGSELSPFHLKVAAILNCKKIAFREFPRQGTSVENLVIQARIGLLKLGLCKLTYPALTDKDELPLVPYLFGPEGEVLYDSTSIAHWLDRKATANNQANLSHPGNDPKIHFLIQLIDEYFDEFGLYMVHHGRWKISAQDNTAGSRLATEMPAIFAPFRSYIDNFFSKRQVRRLPYLFSIAPSGYRINGLKTDRQPPCHKGFPASHQLLELSYINILKACENILSQRPFLFGTYFTLADASLYGQLGMNLADPSAAAWIKSNAPQVFAWLNRIHQGDFSHHQENHELQLDQLIQPLINEISRIFYPLMQQNEDAYIKHKAAGETQFNETAFWLGKSLYQGELDGQAFTAVAKSFQVKTWQQIKQSWQQLAADQQAQLIAKYPKICPLAAPLNTAKQAEVSCR